MNNPLLKVLLTAVIVAASFALPAAAQTPITGSQTAGNLYVGADNGVTSGYGSKIHFWGASSNHDPLWMARYNITTDRSELRINIGDDLNDRFVVGTTYYDSGAWYRHLTVGPNGKVIVGEGLEDNASLPVSGYAPGLEVNGRTLLRGGLDFGARTSDGYGAEGMISWGGNGFSIFSRSGRNLSLGASEREGDFVIRATDGNVGIGTGAPDAKLTVAGRVHAREVKVTVAAGADFVFAEGYALPGLAETEAYVKQHGHLPGIAPAGEMEQNGIDLGEMNIRLLQKVEELTLHLIEQQKQIEALQRDTHRRRLHRERWQKRNTLCKAFKRKTQRL